MKKIYNILVFLITGIQIFSGAQNLNGSKVYEPTDNFVTQWDLSKAGGPETAVSFGATVAGTVNYSWKTADNLSYGSGTIANGSTAVNITGLPSGKTIELSIEPTNFRRFNVGSGADSQRLIDVKQWGKVRWSSMESAFRDCANLNISATDLPDFRNLTSTAAMFWGCSKLSGPSNIGSWDMSGVINMSYMFLQASAFNQNIGNWNVGSVKNMSYVFYRASSFNQNIGNWNVENVTNMFCLFYNATAFNQDIGSWNVGNVTDMTSIFNNASSFNQYIGNWNVGNVTNMSYMFYGASVFNQEIGNWNVSNVTDMSYMFYGASVFNQEIGNWNVSKVTNMFAMFVEASAFKRNIGKWNVGNVTNMSYMFAKASSFNQDIGNWNVGKVTDMSYMFYYASAINQKIGDWNVGNVTNMSFMFVAASAFNQNIGNWNVGNVTDMTSMFNNASAFNQNIGSWNVGKVTNMSYLFYRASAFNQDIGNWNVENVTNMFAMFAEVSAFNQNIGNWNVGKVTNMSYLFYRASAFDQDIGNWNVENVTNMFAMFAEASAFNQNIGNWNVANVTDMYSMFFFAKAFNQNIGSWNVGKVANMSYMFQSASAFNNDISNWNIGNVKNMAGMFYNASAFNQNIGNWKLNANADLQNFLVGSGMDCFNYSATLTGWANNTSTPPGRGLGASGRIYGSNAISGRNALISKGWTITGDVAGSGTCISYSPNSSNIIYVNKSATTGTGGGGSWNDAIAELADALRWARRENNFSYTNPLKIYVARGTYRPLYSAADGQNHNDVGRNNAFVLVKNVQIYGGFDPESGIDDLTKNRISGYGGSVLSGDLGVNDSSLDNSYHVVISSGDAGLGTLDGFMITKGYASGSASIIVNAKSVVQSYGGGIYISNSSPILKNLIISRNEVFSSNFSVTLGAGIYNSFSNPVLTNVNIHSNKITSSISSGGGIYNVNSNPILKDVQIYNNICSATSSSRGGGIFNENSNPILEKVNIYGNTASSSSFYSFGGGMFNINSNPTLENVNVNHNAVTSSNQTFGGGIYNNASNPIIKNTNIHSNSLTSTSNSASGAGIYNVSSSPVMANVTIANNKVRGSSPSNSLGSGIYNSNSSLKIYNSIIWDNSKYDNTFSDIENSGNTEVTIKNSITQSYDSNDMEDNNIIGQDPLFTNPLSGNYSLKYDSPGIDLGSSSLYSLAGGNLSTNNDLAGNSRISECAIDMGAYEYQNAEPYVRWDGAAWNNTTGPTQVLSACINSDYNAANSFATKNLKVLKGILSIPPNRSVTVYGNITQSADNNIILESDANLVQTADDAFNSNHKITVKRDVHMRQLDYTYWGSPVKGQKLMNDSSLNDGFSIGTPNNRIFNYSEPNDYFVAATDQNFISGKGYAIRGKGSFDVNNLTASTYQYNGIINNGIYLVNVQKSKNTKINGVEYEHGYNLIGNPYPSNIDFDKFFNLGANKSKIFGKVWFWTNVAPRLNQSGSGYNGNNYATLTLTGGSPPTTTQPNTGLTPDQFIKVGQGFIVQVRDVSNLTFPTVTHQLDFDNSIRTDQGDIFFNAKTSSTTKDRFWLQLISPQQFTNTILVGYVNGATNDYDGDYDAEMMSIGDDALYILLGSKKNQIDGRQYPLSTNDVIGLGTKYSESGIYQISIAGKEGIFDSSQPVYLRDKLLHKTFNLSEGGYNFQAVKGNNDNRFEIVYKPQSYLDTKDTLGNQIDVYKDELDFVVKSSKVLKQVQMFDMSGKLINTLSKASNIIKISHQNLPNGIYLLKIYGSDNIITKKIIK